MKRIEVWLYESSNPMIHIAKSTYTKGILYCVYTEDEKVFKYPIQHIFRIVEDYNSKPSNN